MDILNAFQYLPDWIKAAFAIILVGGLLYWRTFNGVLKIRKQIENLKEESFNDLMKIHSQLKEEHNQCMTIQAAQQDEINKLKEKCKLLQQKIE